ncbi:hypothetical protein RB593_009127 [Gaeumannomyces tritici]
MKFLVALLALPAVLAAPAELAARQEPPNYVQDNVACACVNAAGEADPNVNCPYGERIGADGAALGLASFCTPVSQYSAPMDKPMTDTFCSRANQAFPKASCKPIKQCLRFPQCPQWKNQFSVCGLPQKLPIPTWPYC